MFKDRFVLALATALLIVCGPAAGAAHATSVWLGVPVYIQQESNWCWAAVAKSSAQWQHASTNPTQCQFVKWGFQSSSCPNQIGDSVTHVPRALASAGVPQGTFYTGTRSWASLTSEVAVYSSPVLAVWQWKKISGGHMVLVRGVDDSVGYNRVSYIDPRYSSYQNLSYTLMVSSSLHSWTAGRYLLRQKG